MAIHCASGIKSALKNEIAIIVTRELLCIIVAQKIPKVILFQVLSVNFLSIFSNHPQVNSLNHCQRKIIQNKKIAIQADILLKFSLCQNHHKSIKTILIQKSFFIILSYKNIIISHLKLYYKNFF